MNWEDELDNFPKIYNQWGWDEDESQEPGEDPDHDRKCETCGSKYCEGECTLLIQDSTQLPYEGA